MSIINKNITLSLLHFNDPSNLLKDEFNNITWSKYGSGITFSSNSKFNGSIHIYSGDIRSSNFSITNNFTFDCWMYVINNSGCIFSLNNGNHSYRIQGSWWFSRWVHDGFENQTFSIPINSWFHLAYVYDISNEKINIFINGKLFKSYYQSMNYGSWSLSLGSYLNCVGEYRQANMYIDELRVSTDKIYSSNFPVEIKEYSFETYKLFEGGKNLYSI